MTLAHLTNYLANLSENLETDELGLEHEILLR